MKHNVFWKSFCRRRLQFRTRVLFLMVLIVAAPCLWLSSEVHQGRTQARIKSHLTRLVAEISYYSLPAESDSSVVFTIAGDYQKMKQANSTPTDRLHRFLGEEFRRPIESVSCQGPNITDRELKMLAAFDQLKWLDITGANITDKGMEYIPRMKSLEVLCLDATGLTDESLTCICRLPKLKWLWLSHTSISDEGVPFLVELSSLEMLWLLDTRVTSAGATVLESRLPDLKLIWSTRRSEAEQAALVELTRLGGEYFCDNDGTDVMMLLEGTWVGSNRDLAILQRIPGLDRVVISWEGLNSDGVHELGKCESLRRLSLRRSPITDMHLRDISEIPQITDLEIGGVSITDAGVAHLARLPQLKRLYLDGDNVTGNSLVHLKEFPKLTSVTIGYTSIKDNDLVALKDASLLEELELEGAFTALAVDHLVNLRGLSHLVFFTSPSLPEDVQCRLKEALPSCELELSQRVE